MTLHIKAHFRPHKKRTAKIAFNLAADPGKPLEQAIIADMEKRNRRFLDNVRGAFKVDVYDGGERISTMVLRR